MGKVFISYNHSDKGMVDTIAQRLEVEFGRKNIFYDSWEIQPGDSIIGTMNEGLEQFSTFFLFASPNSLNSKMVELEWQSALHKAVNEDLKFVVVKIADCNLPTILADKYYIDLYNDGIDAAIEKMKKVSIGENAYTALDEFNNIETKAERIDKNKIRFTIHAKQYVESNPIFAFSCGLSFEEFSVCFNISDGATIQGKDVIKTSGGKILNARTVQLTRSLKPGFPFVFEVDFNTAPIQDIAIWKLINAQTREYSQIAIRL